MAQVGGICEPELVKLSFEQVRRLASVVDSRLRIPGNGNFPTLEMTVRDLIKAVLQRLRNDRITVCDVRINGSTANSIVVGGETEPQVCNDLDLIFRLGASYDLHAVKDSALMALQDFLQPETNRDNFTPAILSQGYVCKLVRIDPLRTGNSDLWSLMSLGNEAHGIGHSVEMKFVVNMERQYEFSVDSFQVIVDGYLPFAGDACTLSDRNMPDVYAVSQYLDFKAAVHHSHNKIIATRKPEAVRGGGLLKFCLLLAAGYRKEVNCDWGRFERLMCSRFFIDFQSHDQQVTQFTNYLQNHFGGDHRRLRLRWLKHVQDVIKRAAKCIQHCARDGTLQIINSLRHTIEVEERCERHYGYSALRAVSGAGARGAANIHKPPQSSSTPLTSEDDMSDTSSVRTTDSPRPAPEVADSDSAGFPEGSQAEVESYPCPCPPPYFMANSRQFFYGPPPSFFNRGGGQQFIVPLCMPCQPGMVVYHIPPMQSQSMAISGR